MLLFWRSNEVYFRDERKTLKEKLVLNLKQSESTLLLFHQGITLRVGNCVKQ